MNCEEPIEAWAKLIAQHPHNKDIVLRCKPNERNDYREGSEWVIYQDQITKKIWIENLSATSYILVDNTWLKEDGREKLTGGERIAFKRRLITQDDNDFDYVFSLGSHLANNELKRPRDKILEIKDSNPPKKIRKESRGFERKAQMWNMS